MNSSKTTPRRPGHTTESTEVWAVPPVTRGARRGVAVACAHHHAPARSSDRVEYSGAVNPVLWLNTRGVGWAPAGGDVGRWETGPSRREARGPAVDESCPCAGDSPSWLQKRPQYLVDSRSGGNYALEASAESAQAGAGPVTVPTFAEAKSTTVGIVGAKTPLTEDVLPEQVSLASGPPGWTPPDVTELPLSGLSPRATPKGQLTVPPGRPARPAAGAVSA